MKTLIEFASIITILGGLYGTTQLNASHCKTIQMPTIDIYGSSGEDVYKMKGSHHRIPQTPKISPIVKKPKVWICGEWEDSMVGGQYRVCSWK